MLWYVVLFHFCFSLPTIYSHVILVFFFQPVLDGPDATKAIRALGYTGPIIGCTGNTLDIDLLRFKESGGDRVIGKPFLHEMFHQFMNELLLTNGQGIENNEVEAAAIIPNVFSQSTHTNPITTTMGSHSIQLS